MKIILKNLVNNIVIITINLHCDFEKGISNATKTFILNINIKDCV